MAKIYERLLSTNILREKRRYSFDPQRSNLLGEDSICMVNYPGKNIRWDPANPNWDPRCVPSGIPPSFGGIPLGIPPGIMEHPRWDPTWDPAK